MSHVSDSPASSIHQHADSARGTWSLEAFPPHLYISPLTWRPSIFVGIPKIAQSKINDAELHIDGIIVSNTEPEKYNMAVNSTITTDGSVHADIEGFTGVMYLEDLEPHEPFASIDFPDTTSAKFTEVNVSQPVEVTNMEAFTTFNTWLLANETLKLTIEGDTKVRVKGISKSFGVTFKKTVDLKGRFPRCVLDCGFGENMCADSFRVQVLMASTALRSPLPTSISPPPRTTSMARSTSRTPRSSPSTL